MASNPTQASAAHRPLLAGLPLYECRPEDEYLHAPAPSGHYSSTETSYFGFNIPEKAINGEIYMWFHPILRMFSASIYIWKGFKRTTLSCEYVSHYHYLPYPENGIADYIVSDEMNLHVKVIEPLQKISTTFHDAARNVSFSLMHDAIMPPAGRPGGFHFAQAMRVTGELNLFGETHRVDGFFTRDRSWSQERRETGREVPPLTWITGVFDQDFAFHAVGFDEPELDPEWRSRYPSIKSGETLRWGYVYRNGVVRPLQSMRKLTHREADGISPRVFDLELIVEGERYGLKGTVQARMPWQTWQNMNVYFCQTRWEVDGRIGFGDAHEVQMNDYIHHFHRDAG